jgi:1-acyl-sn-glycerol-3-phosphate acyltransferase
MLAFRVRYTGAESVPKEGAILVVANHQSFLDPPLVGAGFPRMMNYMARKTLFRFAPFAWLIRSYNAFPIDQEGSALGGVKETLRRLKSGEVVLVFPEGARTPDGEITPFLPGFAALAVRSRAMILPAAIEGAFQAWPRTRRWPRPGRVRVHFGDPISAADVQQMDERELVAELERRVRAYHSDLRNQLHLSGPGDPSPAPEKA